MRLWLALPCMFAALTGCQQQSAGEVTTEVTSNEEEAAPGFHLSCSGTTTEPMATPYKQTKLFSVPGSDNEHLTEYRESEKLYYEVCATSIFTCALDLTDEIIRERGVQLGSANVDRSSMSLVINRRTGRIVQESRYGSTVLSSFEGTCKPASPPPEEQAKF